MLASLPLRRVQHAATGERTPCHGVGRVDKKDRTRMPGKSPKGAARLVDRLPALGVWVGGEERVISGWCYEK